MSGLVRVIAGLFPPGVGKAALAIGAAPRLFPVEAAAVAQAVPQRVAEFAAGRAAARVALAAAGLPVAAIPMGADRAPVWPDGTTGSITHGGDYALAVAASLDRFSALGLDAEPDQPLPYDVLDEICDSDECSWIAGQAQPLRWARLIFVVKEAAYKCQYPISKTLFGFDAMTVRINPEARTVTAQFRRSVPFFDAGTILHGRFDFAGSLVLAGFALKRPDAA